MSRNRFVPPQHGAWAMLLLPWLAGVLTAGFRWPHLPLLVAWLAAYLFSYYFLQAVKTRRLARVRAQLLLYGPVAAVPGALVLLVRPQLLWYGPAFAALFAVNVAYARRRDERALVNDLASVVQSCLMVFVCATVAGRPLAEAVPVFAAVTAYFTGTVLYVKTMIRERGSVGYYRASVLFHLAALGAAWWVGVPVLVVFAFLLARAALLPGRRLTPKQVGLIEIAATVLLLVLLLVMVPVAG
ncbi:YwiC-like family protein [Dactylosporangium sp. NPDC006015]|uniref:YwiC-like family protein n=1 Tax=Dactylosporangium sp. NPDC006015 TaxID=3154576 RepID=UPI0033A6252A